MAPSIVLCAEDNFRTIATSRRHGLAALTVDALRDLVPPGPADDVWILPRDPASVTTISSHPLTPQGGFREEMARAALLCPPGCERLDAGVALALVIGRGVTVALDVGR